MENTGSGENLPTRDIYRVHLEQTMRYYLQNLNDSRLSRKKGALRVLSAGCGLGYEAKPVLSIFPNAHYRGIDINDGLIMGAKDVNRDLPPEQVELTTEDAAHLEESEIGKYGLIIIRHPQLRGTLLNNSLYGSHDMWKNIIESTLKKVSSDGYVFTTVDDEEERDIMLDYLKEQGMEILVNERNHGSTISVPTYKDSLVILAHKK